MSSCTACRPLVEARTMVKQNQAIRLIQAAWPMQKDGRQTGGKKQTASKMMTNQ